MPHGVSPRWLRWLSSTGLSITASKIPAARAAGATDLEIHDTVLIAAALCVMNRYVDGLTAITRKTRVYAAGAQRLIKDGYVPLSA